MKSRDAPGQGEDGRLGLFHLEHRPSKEEEVVIWSAGQVLELDRKADRVRAGQGCCHAGKCWDWTHTAAFQE